MSEVQNFEHFLIIFDRDQNRLVDVIDFGSDGERALEAYSAKEQEHEGQRNIEIVLIASDSLDTVKLTHANYFDDEVASSRFLAGVWGRPAGGSASGGYGAGPGKVSELSPPPRRPGVGSRRKPRRVR